ncbi:MAG: protease inhibitor I42 family protein [Dehalococcoidales bacterium]|nr:protease inhibitor I42 family protein [Dehalococcoidales bacterium]
MKLKLFLIGVVTITLLALMACTSAPKQVSVDDSHSGKEIKIGVGGTLTVSLSSNQTTGFQWELKEIGDTGLIQKTDSQYEAPTSGLVGAGGTEIWTFRALKAGTTTITMEYSRPWEGGEQAVNTFNLTVVIK